MRRHRRLLNILNKDNVTNEEVRRKIQTAITEYRVKKRKLRWLVDISMSSGLAKTILHGTVKGKRRKGRQKKRWEDNIKEWQEWTLQAHLGRLKTGQGGKVLLRCHIWCPDDPPGLWDRIEQNKPTNQLS